LEEEKNLKESLELLKKEYANKNPVKQEHIPTVGEMKDNIQNLSNFLNNKENDNDYQKQLAEQNYRLEEKNR